MSPRIQCFDNTLMARDLVANYIAWCIQKNRDIDSVEVTKSCIIFKKSLFDRFVYDLSEQMIGAQIQTKSAYYDERNEFTVKKSIEIIDDVLDDFRRKIAKTIN